MTFDDLITYCEPVRHFGTPPKALGVLVQDSRKVVAGAVFIAVRGFTVDGHAFIEKAIAKGAGVIICEEYSGSDAQETYIIQVEDTRSLIGPLAQMFEGKPADQLTLTGITGTNGKTTVATLTYQVLQQLGVRISLLGTVAKYINDEVQDSRLTTADPIELAGDMHRMVEAGSTHLVMEVSSHALHQQRAKGLDFDVAAFTNLSHDHLDYHTTVEKYAKAKKQLFDGLSSQATAIINADDSQSRFMTADCQAQTILFGFEKDTDVPCTITQSDSKGLILEVAGTTIESPLVGRFNAYNVAQTFLICRTLGFTKTTIVKALATATGAPGRLERVQGNNDRSQPLVMVDYAHTPAALENVLSTLASIKEKEHLLHVVFGCGGDRDKTKRPAMASIAEQFADLITITSDNPRNEDPETIIDDAMEGFVRPQAVNRITDRREAITRAIVSADTNTIVLIAGKGHETYQEIEGKRYPFDDREIARKALNADNHNVEKPEVH